MNDKIAVEEILEEVSPLTSYTGYVPCQDGHVFVWSSSATTAWEPPDGTLCICGKVSYRKGMSLDVYPRPRSSDWDTFSYSNRIG
jgi:hypothetical protein